MLAGLGADVRIEADEFSVTLKGPAKLGSIDWEIPGDFSSAAFFIVAMLLAADSGAEILNVGLNPTRIGLLHILRAMGGEIEIRNERVVGGEPVGDLWVRRSELAAIDIPLAHVASAIDEFPVLFVAAAAARGTSRLRGAEELRHKETDRLAVMAKALTAVGIQVQEYPDGMDITGGEIRGGALDSAGDHRVAMAMAVASLRASAPIQISHTAQVATSFPGFVAAAAGAGLQLREAAAGNR
jgi:3-phosphoshikimate 1-carboxyvinyltransferase